MVRAIIFALLSVLAITFLRGIIGLVTRGMAEALRGNGAAGQPSATRQPDPATFGGDLVKDPVCGTFVSVKSPFTKSTGGNVHHFCSQACLDRFAVS